VPLRARVIGEGAQAPRRGRVSDVHAVTG
jgi:hypothetical protein